MPCFGRVMGDSAALPMVNAEALNDTLGSGIKPDSLLVSDGHGTYPPCAAALGLRDEAFVLFTGERVRGALHIRTVKQPSQPAQGLPAPLPRCRNTLSRQLPAMVPPPRTGAPAIAKIMPRSRHEQNYA